MKQNVIFDVATKLKPVFSHIFSAPTITKLELGVGLRKVCVAKRNWEKRSENRYN